MFRIFWLFVTTACRCFRTRCQTFLGVYVVEITDTGRLATDKGYFSLATRLLGMPSQPSGRCSKCSVTETAKELRFSFQVNRSMETRGRSMRMILHEFNSPRPRVEVAVPA